MAGRSSTLAFNLAFNLAFDLARHRAALDSETDRVTTDWGLVRPIGLFRAAWLVQQFNLAGKQGLGSNKRPGDQEANREEDPTPIPRIHLERSNAVGCGTTGGGKKTKQQKKDARVCATSSFRLSSRLSRSARPDVMAQSAKGEGIVIDNLNYVCT